MTRRLVTALVLVAVLVGSIPVHADGKKIGGALLATAGTLMMVGAFNYHGYNCAEGDTLVDLHVSGSTPQCVYTSSSYVSVTDADYKVTFDRPALMWGGLGAATVGVVLLLLPKRAATVVDVSVTPTGWLASKTFGF